MGPDERDRSLEQWLRHAATEPAAPAGACIDAETAAAWVDGTLSGNALELTRLHVADCARCQALVATIVRVETSAPAAPARDVRRWRGWLSWAVPVSVAATAVVAISIWVSIPPKQPSVSVTGVAGSQQVPLPEVPERQSFTGAPRAADAAPAAASAESIPPAPQVPDAGMQKADGGSAVASPSAPPAPPSAPLPVPFSPDAARAARNETQAGASSQFASAATEIVSPDPAIRWRIVGATVQRSLDGGAVWSAVNTGAPGPVVAGAAPASSTCWLVGPGGVVLLTTDGMAWSRLPFPEPVDLVAVRAVDAREATITAADNRTFRTTDGGTTWSRNQ
jgi:hypothetical protein